MAHIEDRWFKTIEHPGGGTERVKTTRHGKGNRYRVRYIGPDGKERSQSFPDRAKRDAEAFMVSVESDKLRGSYIDPVAGRMLFGDYAESWLRTRTFDESTREATEYRVRKHILPYFGDRQLGAIKPGQIREWDHGLARVLAPATRSVIFTHLRAILAAAVDDERIAKNPCSAKSVQQPKPVERKVTPWKITTVSAIRTALPERYRAMVDLGGGCGERQGEIFGVAPDDFDFEGGWVYVRRQVKLVRSRLVFGLPKSDQERKVPLSGSVAAAIRAHMAVFPPITVTLPWEDPASDEVVSVALVFTTTRRGAVNRGHFDQKIWHPALTRVGILPTRETGMHALRHFYASALLDAGENIKALSQYLGHKDPGSRSASTRTSCRRARNAPAGRSTSSSEAIRTATAQGRPGMVRDVHIRRSAAKLPSIPGVQVDSSVVLLVSALTMALSWRYWLSSLVVSGRHLVVVRRPGYALILDGLALVVGWACAVAWPFPLD